MPAIAAYSAAALVLYRAAAFGTCTYLHDRIIELLAVAIPLPLCHVKLKGLGNGICTGRYLSTA